MDTKELVIGCGYYRKKRIYANSDEYVNPVYLDIYEGVKPDIVWDLNNRPLPFDDNEFSEIHAYDVLEHIGQQGDWRGFFEEFNEYYRIIKPGGVFCITAPLADKKWAWGDPGHTRIISKGLFSFLDQDLYTEGETSMTDYRFVYNGNFKFIKELTGDGEIGAYVLQAVK